MRNRTKEVLMSGERAVGAFVPLPSPGLVEMLGFAGFDFLVLDGEHGAVTVDAAEGLIRAAEVSGATPVVRVGSHRPDEIVRFLDRGAQGIQVPCVETPEQASDLVRAARYAPEGTRGCSLPRTARYGFGLGFREHMELANREVMVIVQIETRRGMEHAAGIAAVPGVDAVFIGPADLSVSLGVPGELTHPTVVSAIEQIASEVKAAGKVVGVFCTDGDQARHFADQGFRYIVTNTRSLLGRGCDEFFETLGAR